jgi:hypothetical protein
MYEWRKAEERRREGCRVGRIESLYNDPHQSIYVS